MNFIMPLCLMCNNVMTKQYIDYLLFDNYAIKSK